MAGITLDDFVGGYILRQGSYGPDGGPIEPVTPGAAVVILKIDSTKAQVTIGTDNPDVYTFDPANHYLYQVGADTLYRQISMVLDAQSGLGFRAVYGTVIAGDPEQVGVWGADDHP
jgi:hypothetical protein